MFQLSGLLFKLSELIRSNLSTFLLTFNWIALFNTIKNGVFISSPTHDHKHKKPQNSILSPEPVSPFLHELWTEFHICLLFHYIFYTFSLSLKLVNTNPSSWNALTQLKQKIIDASKPLKRSTTLRSIVHHFCVEAKT